MQIQNSKIASFIISYPVTSTYMDNNPHLK